MKKLLITLLFINLYFTANAYTPEESCYMRTWEIWSIEINWKCICKNWYKNYWQWYLDCRLDHESCKAIYWINSEMKTSWICWCKTGNELIKWLNWNYSCKSWYAECRLRFWDYASYFSSSWKCWCQVWYKFSDTVLFQIWLDDNYLVSNKCVKNHDIILDNTESSTINSNNSDLVLDNSSNPNTMYIESAKFLAKNWIIKEQTNEKNYNVDNSISRREMLKIIMKLSWKNVSGDCEWNFKDLWKNDWGCVYAESALSFWYISNNWIFRPNDNVSKIEAIKMIFQAKWILVERTSDWRVWYINKWVEEKLFDNFTDYNSNAKRWFIFNIASDIISNENLSNMFDDLSDEDSSNQTISCWKNSSPSSVWNCLCNSWYVWEDKNDESNLDCVEEETSDDVFNGLFDE